MKMVIDWTDKTQNHNERIKFLVLHHTVSDSPADTIAAFNAGPTGPFLCFARVTLQAFALSDFSITTATFVESFICLP